MLTYDLEQATGPLYQYIYQCLKDDIMTGGLQAGDKLPSKRTFARNHGISTITIQNAYDQLISEGYIYTVPKKGYYVAKIRGMRQVPKETNLSLNIQRQEKKVEYAVDLSDNRMSPERFPFTVWAKIGREIMSDHKSELMEPSPAGGTRALREAVAEHLKSYRAMLVDPDQIVVGAGLEYLLGLLAPLLPGPAAVETPGYPRALQVLQNNGVHCCCLPVDEDGLSVEALNRSDAAVCYVTPSHQFPTGVTMPAGRRAELLHWAARRPGGRYIIEDDYDSEFRFDTRPLPSLQGMAGADGPVVYLSTCSRSLAPSIRIAYMVLPEHLLPAWREKYRLYSGTVSRFEQQTLARFITEGYFTRHLARERVAYKARRDALAAALTAAFGPEELTLAGLHTGLHLLAKLRDPPPDDALRRAAEAEGVQLGLLSDYDLTGEAPSAAGTLVLGYGSLKDEACASVGETLKKVCTAAREASVTV